MKFKKNKISKKDRPFEIQGICKKGGYLKLDKAVRYYSRLG